MTLNINIKNKCIVLHLQVEIFHYNCVQDAVSQSLRQVHYLQYPSKCFILVIKLNFQSCALFLLPL
jgi:hypothetical protein